jgi:hypothetical protein
MGVTYHLRANQPYKLLVRDALTGVEIEERFYRSRHDASPFRAA